MRNRIKDSIKKPKIVFIITAILLVILSLTISYAAFSDHLTITNIVSHIRVYKEVRINGVTTSSGAVSDLDYNTNSILNTVYIPAGESVTYSVTATNLGNVPVAVSAVSFSNGNGAVANLSSEISTNNYIKICDDNNPNNCTNGVSKTFDVTITNTGSSTISTNLDVNLTFLEVYTINYEGNLLSERVAGSNYTYTFPSNAPAKLAKISGTCDSFNYTSGTLTITNIGSNLNFAEAHTITYNGENQGYIADGGTYTYTFESQWPATVVKESGTSGNLTYQNHTITIPNVTSDIVLTGTIGKVEITRIQYVEGTAKNVVENPPSQPTFHDMDAAFNVTFQRPEGSTETDFEIIYEVDIKNTHYDDYIFRGFDFHPTITASADSDTANLELIPIGINNGDSIAEGTTKTFRVKLKLETNNPDGNYGTSSQTQVDTTPDTEEETGTITATISPTTGNLRAPNTRAEFTLSVTSTYQSEREFNLILSNSNLEIVDNNGNAIENLTIHGESTETYTIYIKSVTGATYLQNTTTTNVYLGTAGSPNISIDTLTLNVDIYDVPDNKPPIVGNVQISMHRDSNNVPTVGQIDVTWDRIDNGGYPVTDYVIQLYNSSNTLVGTAGHTNAARPREYSFTGIADGTYKAVVYGIDTKQDGSISNSGASYASASTGTANGYASASNSSPFKWRFNVDTSGITSNLTIGGNDNYGVAYLDDEYTLTVTARGNTSGVANKAPEDLTVTMGTNNQKLTKGTDYDYSRSGTNDTVGTLKIHKNVIKDNLKISGDHIEGCLVEGTKILLANGKYKNIENVTYDDLLLVYSHETGKFVPEYPIWIENTVTTNIYQENTFSDGTVLKTVGYHGIFEPELGRFVSVDNPKEFHVGSKVAKMKKDGTGFETVTVTKIEKKLEKVRYYQVASTRYFNVIANDFITTDGHVEISNLYGFNNDLTWPKEIRAYAMQNVYSYDELSDSIPYYIFKGMRAEEGKILANYGISIHEYKSFIKMISNLGGMLKPPINNLGRNMWMVTTSEDNVTDLNKNTYLQYEGTNFTLPKSKKNDFIGWYSTSDNKVYYPGDKITIYHGMYFEAIYK